MRQLHQNLNIPWLLIGDLNEIQFLHEKEGGNPRPIQYMQAFQECIDDCELHDLGYVGDRFTWYRGRIRERLDRGLINDSWASLFPRAALENLEYNHSDHRPLLVNTEYYGINGSATGATHPKRFEARWLREEQFPDLVLDIWEKLKNDPASPGVFEKLTRCIQSFMIGTNAF